MTRDNLLEPKSPHRCWPKDYRQYDSQRFRRRSIYRHHWSSFERGTGWLGRFFGRKRFLITCIGIFTIASALCGLASSLGLLILARVLQGIGGGPLQPIAQAVLLESFPLEKRGSAMSVYAIGVVVAPILGPTLGGWLTDNYSWRWVFYINIPIGILAVILCSLLLEDPPYLKDARPGRIDFIGFALLTIWIGCGRAR